MKYGSVQCGAVRCGAVQLRLLNNLTTNSYYRKPCRFAVVQLGSLRFAEVGYGSLTFSTWQLRVH